METIKLKRLSQLKIAVGQSGGRPAGSWKVRASASLPLPLAAVPLCPAGPGPTPGKEKRGVHLPSVSHLGGRDHALESLEGH